MTDAKEAGAGNLAEETSYYPDTLAEEKPGVPLKPCRAPRPGARALVDFLRCSSVAPPPRTRRKGGGILGRASFRGAQPSGDFAGPGGKDWVWGWSPGGVVSLRPPGLLEGVPVARAVGTPQATRAIGLRMLVAASKGQAA